MRVEGRDRRVAARQSEGVELANRKNQNFRDRAHLTDWGFCARRCQTMSV